MAKEGSAPFVPSWMWSSSVTSITLSSSKPVNPFRKSVVAVSGRRCGSGHRKKEEEESVSGRRSGSPASAIMASRATEQGEEERSVHDIVHVFFVLGDVLPATSCSIVGTLLSCENRLTERGPVCPRSSWCVEIRGPAFRPRCGSEHVPSCQRPPGGPHVALPPPPAFPSLVSATLR